MPAPQQRWWGGALDAETLARDAVQRVRDAARAVAAARDLEVEIETSHPLIAASFAAIDHLRIDGRPAQPWGELSGFVAARDGWVRLHGNYPHHAAVLRAVLDVEDRAGLERAIARWDAADVEERVVAAGGIAAAVRDEAQWRAHPHARATAQEPWAGLVDRGERGMLPPAVPGAAGRRTVPGESSAGDSSAGDPSAGGDAELLAGVRVLDLTRVIAGPTCTQLLACLGAEVLRLGPPHRPELLDQHLSTGMGVRPALLDLRREEARARLRRLAADADVILTGYRPGALDRHGLGPADLEELAPHAVLGVLSAWGTHGPWGGRAGFDSIVQAATGIAVRCGSEERPGVLPVQALDHATGHLLAAHVLDALARGRAVTVRASLLGAARALLALPAPSGEVAALPVPLRQVASGAGALEVVPPPLTVGGRTLERDVGADGAERARWHG